VSLVVVNQPEGTPTWIDRAVPDLDRAMAFYRAVFGWDYDVGPAESDRYTMCLVRGLPVAGLVPTTSDDAVAGGWNVYFAADNCDTTAARIAPAGGTLTLAPVDIGARGRVAVARDAVGARFGLWQGRGHLGCELVNEPNTLVRNDLATADPERARAFYTAVFGFTLDRNEDLPDFDFTFLRRPDGHEIGGIFGDPEVGTSAWATVFEVSDTDAVVVRAVDAGGTAEPAEDTPYGRIANLTDPFGAQLSVITRRAEP